MKKHKERRKQRQAAQIILPGYFYRYGYSRCASKSCRRARKCLSRAEICACTIDFAAAPGGKEYDETRELVKTIRMELAKREHFQALGLLPPDPPHPILDDPNIPQEEKDKVIRAEIAERLERLL